MDIDIWFNRVCIETFVCTTNWSQSFHQHNTTTPIGCFTFRHVNPCPLFIVQALSYTSDLSPYSQVISINQSFSYYLLQDHHDPLLLSMVEHQHISPNGHQEAQLFILMPSSITCLKTKTPYPLKLQSCEVVV